MERAAAKREAKRGRYKLRRLGQAESIWRAAEYADSGRGANVLKCGRVSRLPGGNVPLVVQDGTPDACETATGAGYRGVVHCGSWSNCTVCSAVIARTRADDLGEFLAWVTRAGHTAAMMTLTLKHHRGHGLAELLKATSKAWDACKSGRFWTGDTDPEYAKLVATWEDRLARDPARRPNERDATYDRRCARRLDKLRAERPVRDTGLKGRFGILGYVRASEITIGEHGWHPHLHVVLVFEGRVSPQMVRLAGEEMWQRWVHTLNRHGYDATREVWDREQRQMVPAGFDIRTSTEETETRLAEYLVKQLAVEVTHGQQKKGRTAPGESKRSRTPFQLLADVGAHGDAEALDRWHEYEQAIHGRKQLSWSEGLRQLAGMRQELTDDEVVDQDQQGKVAVNLPPPTWVVVRDVQEELVFAAEDGGIAGAVAWLDARGLDYDVGPIPNPSGAPPDKLPVSYTVLTV